MRKILVVASAFVLAVALAATIARASDPQGNPVGKVTIPVDLAGVTCPAKHQRSAGRPRLLGSELQGRTRRE